MKFQVGDKVMVFDGTLAGGDGGAPRNVVGEIKRIERELGNLRFRIHFEGWHDGHRDACGGSCRLDYNLYDWELVPFRQWINKPMEGTYV